MIYLGKHKDGFVSPIYQYENNENQLYIKRDDLIPYCFGGNKARMVMKYFETIDNGNYDAVVTYGGSSSNLCRIIANMSASRNLPCYIVTPSCIEEETFNSEIIKSFGNTRIINCELDYVHETIEKTTKSLCKNGHRPFFIAGGGHGIIGTDACTECYREILDYERTTGVTFDYIFLTSGTGTTQSGLISEQIILQDNTKRIIGISEARKNPRGRDIVIRAIKDYLDYKNILYDDQIIDKRTIFIDEYTGEGYGKSNSGITDLIDVCMRQYGIPLDPVYTGKGYFGMLDYIRKNDIKGSNVLFIHTGGTPLFFDYQRKR